jgi:DNA-binding NarL/FixJ family response regulator
VARACPWCGGTAPCALPASGDGLRVVLLDQYTFLRGAFRALLVAHPQFTIVGEAVPGPGAVEVVAQHQPDLILLNLLLQPHALELIPLLVTAAQAQLLVVAALHDMEVHGQAVHHGATGVIPADQPPAVLLTAIAAMRTGELWVERQVLAQVLTNLVQGCADREGDAERRKLATLTQRERAVMALVAAGLPNREIAQCLRLAEATMRHHLTSVFDKLGLVGRAELIVYAYRHGLVTRSS